MNDNKNEVLTPGTTLKQERLKQNLAVDDISAKLYLTNQVVGYLEEDDFAKLPGDVFVRGYLRSYAKALGLDDGSIISSYEAIAAPIVSDELKDLQLNVPQKSKANYWLASFLGFMLLCGLAWFIVNNGNKNVSDVNLGEEAVEELEATSPQDLSLIAEDSLERSSDFILEQENESNIEQVSQEEQVVKPQVLQITFTGDCWVKIVDGDNKVLVSAIYKKGDVLETSGKEPLAVNLGNGKNVEVSYGGEVVKFRLRSTGSASFNVITPKE